MKKQTAVAVDFFFLLFALSLLRNNQGGMDLNDLIAWVDLRRRRHRLVDTTEGVSACDSWRHLSLSHPQTSTNHLFLKRMYE